MPSNPKCPTGMLTWAQPSIDLGGCPDDRLQGEWDAIGHLLVWAEGHGDHGGWTFDSTTKLITCACGEDLFEYMAVEPVVKTPHTALGDARLSQDIYDRVTGGER